jgi:translocation and assembly module TamB
MIDSDLVDATIDADLALSGALGRAPDLAGTVEIARMTVRIAESLPGGVTTIEAIEVNPTPDLVERVEAARAAREGQTAGGATVPLSLDLTLRAPGTVFVTGRGLDARMSGSLDIGGTANAPRIDGSLGLDRGTLEVLTKRFTFTRGQITFLGGALDPALDFRAETPAGDVTGIVTVGGFASDPTLALSSEPELPEDEVLSQILFGKGTGQLSTFEAVQLGQQAAELAGVLPPGSGLVENVRRSTGLDVLNVETGEDGEAALTAGQFVGEGVFVGVEQSLGSNESNVTVEVDITDTIKLETDLGSTGSTRIGVGMEFDY